MSILKEKMINFYSENEFHLPDQEKYREWISKVIASEGMELGEISFIFCDDEYLLEINQKYLNHDTYTDIISFDDSVGKILSGDIFISIDRVRENALDYDVAFDKELQRVLIHGVLHFAGYGDKSEKDQIVMRAKEEEKIEMFHVEQ